MNNIHKESIYNVMPSSFSKEMIVPTSKSHGNRLLILAAICKGETILQDLPFSTDVIMMLASLRTIGLEIEGNHQKLIIKNSFPECEKLSSSPIILETGDGGTTNRFLIPLLSLGRNTYQVEPSEKMRERPMEELYNVLKKHDVLLIAPRRVGFF